MPDSATRDTAPGRFDLLSWATGFGTGLILGSVVVGLAVMWVLR